MSIIRPGSHCPNCQTALRWFDNIPVVSYLLLFQKCRYCRQYIPLRYPGVELLTCALWCWVTWFGIFGPLGSLDGVPWAGVQWDGIQWDVMLVQLAFGSALIAITFIDFDLRIIPDEISLGGMVVGPLVSVLVPGLHTDFTWLQLPPQLAFLSGPRGLALVASCTGIVVGVLIILAIAKFGKFLFGKEAMGMGDVKLIGFIGAVVGWKGVLTTLMVACVTGGFFGILRKLISGDSYLPFGPCLALGAFLSLLYRTQIWGWLTVSYPQWLQNHFINMVV